VFVELHLIQNFAPSNLNRDDTGAPKDCEFGGYRRARISSQCLKRAIRTHVRETGLVQPEHLGTRTKRVVDEIANRLVAKDKSAEEVRPVVETLLAGAELKVGEDGKTQYLLYLGEREIDAVTDLCALHWDLLQEVAGAAPAAPTGDEVAGRSGRSARQAKRAGREALPKDLQQALKALLDGGKAVDLALFGRMLADVPEANIDAASQVAHALSTHAVSMEFDYYTAVDDLRPEDTSGADMIGTVEFNSACFYRYSNVNLRQLTERNLGGDAELARQALRAFLLGSIRAVPTGKQHSMAAQNPPSFLLAVVRGHGLWSLANAYVQPVRPTRDSDLVAESVVRLDGYWGELVDLYGDGGIVAVCAAGRRSLPLHRLAGARVDRVSELIDRICAAAFDASAVQA
jgi:CRISPR system Cascade subunit CasC